MKSCRRRSSKLTVRRSQMINGHTVTLSISELPPEVLHLIIGLLSNDQSYIFDDDSPPYHLMPAAKYWARMRTLFNLCLVDKKFATIGREYLYKHFYSVSDTSSLFLRTMVQQPQYREYVRCLRIEPQGTRWSWKNVANDSVSDWSAFAYHSILHTAGTVSKCFPPLLMHSGMVLDGRLKQENIVQWLLINLRNVEALCITAPAIPEIEEWAFKIMNHIIQYSGTILPHLEHLKISDLPDWLELRKGQDYITNLTPVRSLLDLATLKRVDFGRCVEFDPGDHYWDNLRSLSHSMCHFSECQIARLVPKCPTLESFYLEGTPSKAFDLSCLSGCEETLQKLELDVWYLMPVPLTEFIGLKAVTISTTVILPNAMAWKRRERHSEKATYRATNALAYMLPNSLEHLCLRFNSIFSYRDVWQRHTDHLIINELSRLQNLQKVKLTWQPSEEMRNALSQARVALECVHFLQGRGFRWS